MSGMEGVVEAKPFITETRNVTKRKIFIN